MTAGGALARIASGETLPSDAMATLFAQVFNGDAAPEFVAGLLMALKTRGETVEDLVGAVEALQAHSLAVRTPDNAIDTCGTGGDGLNSRNVSTAAAIVVAACGVAVAKHGNRSATSRSSSAGVLEALGVQVDLPPSAVETCLQRLGIGFMLANRYHAAMAQVAPVRRALGVPTLFNLIGPLANPGRVRHQVVGVYDPRWLDPMAHALRRLGVTRAWVVHGAGGMDELSPAGASQIVMLAGDTFVRETVHPEAIGLHVHPVSALAGGDAADNAQALRRLLAGEPGAYRETVLLNAAAALQVAGKAADWREGIGQAVSAIDSGAAARLLDAWAALSQDLRA
ncbi:MAG: anthranilate phosphoribosyltransferase [Sphingomonadales bacterium]|nr:MAG: anthranilate phosphoribosyltransferase [Sphingomonadales bacterium]